MRTERLVMVTLDREADAALLDSLNSDPDIREYFGSRGVSPTRLRLDPQVFVIRHKGNAVGVVALIRRHAGADYEAVAAILEGERRKGFAREAVRGLVEWAFQALQCPRVVGCVRIGNEPSERLVDAVGMVDTGEVTTDDERVFVLAPPTERARRTPGDVRDRITEALTDPADADLPPGAGLLEANQLRIGAAEEAVERELNADPGRPARRDPGLG